jgi:hypothetical protein
MAEELRIGPVNVKERGPLVVWLLIVVTLGIYGLVHWYKINREMRDYSEHAGAPLGNDPALSLLALFPGGIVIVPAIWTWVTTTQRAQAVRRMAAGDAATEVPSVFLGVLLGFIYATNHPYLQSSLNATWRMAGATSAVAAAPPEESPPAEPAA